MEVRSAEDLQVEARPTTERRQSWMRMENLWRRGKVVRGSSFSTSPMFYPLLLLLLLSALPSPSSSSVVSEPTTDLTDLCCATEISPRISDHAILANSRDRTLVRLYKTSAYNQMLVETYCMSLVDRHLHITVHPRCVGQCRQVKEPQDVIVVDEHGNRDIKQVLVNSGCVFVPL